ncbi:MAG TPA: MFS transporter, partial [Streptosporangiaceae bacterium]
AAAIFPLALSVLPVLFEGADRQRAVAAIGGASMLSFPIGPIVGGYLLDHFWWGSVFLINVPVVVLALIAVALLLPESRSAQRPSVDALGVLLSSAGLAALTYGFIKAGQDGWTDGTALGTIGAGVAVLAVLVAWERWLTGRNRAAQDGSPRGGAIRPLIELRLFRSAGFTWGTILSTLVSFAMFGIFFAMPLYFQEVRGVNAMGSGLRLLPMIGGMVIGMIGSTRLASPRPSGPDGTARAPLASVKGLVTVGFALMAITLGAGATTTVSSGTGFAAAWFAVFGLGLGLAMPQAMNAALSALSAERSGAGSALISAMRQVGATIGVAVLGTVLDSVYRGHLTVTHLPAAAATAAKSSVVAGVGVAHALGSAGLLDSVRHAFVQGMDTMLWACGGIALVSAILALIFLPRRTDGALEVTQASGAQERAELEA